MSEWISVEDRLPDIDDCVLAYFCGGDGIVIVGVSSHVRACMACDEYSPYLSGISHWMPLPTPPED